MNETENQPNMPLQEDAAPAEPIQHEQTEVGEEIASPPAVGEIAPPPGKPKRVPEKFSTWFWWALFVFGVLVFFMLTSVFWVLLGYDPYHEAIEPLGLICGGPFWLLMNLVILLVFFWTKLHASIYGYMTGYILNFIVSLFLQLSSGAICGVPFYISSIK